MNLPEPLTPPDCDLSDFQYMDLDVRRLRDSKFAAGPSGEAFRAGVLLWCAAWHQVPAASLPDDDKWLARATGTKKSKWTQIKPIALHGWVLCSDGRYYHPVIAERALRAWLKKQVRMRKVIRRLQIQSGEWAAMRKAVFERDGYRCNYCGMVGVRLEADHVIPVSRGGATVESNLVTSCKPCNRAKGVKSVTEWLG